MAFIVACIDKGVSPNPDVGIRAGWVWLRWR